MKNICLCMLFSLGLLGHVAALTGCSPPEHADQEYIHFVHFDPFDGRTSGWMITAYDADVSPLPLGESHMLIRVAPNTLKNIERYIRNQSEKGSWPSPIRSPGSEEIEYRIAINCSGEKLNPSDYYVLTPAQLIDSILDIRAIVFRSETYSGHSFLFTILADSIDKGERLMKVTHYRSLWEHRQKTGRESLSGNEQEKSDFEN